MLLLICYFKTVLYVPHLRYKQIFPGYSACEPEVVKDRVEGLKENYEDLCKLASQRQAKLDESRRMHQFFASITEEISWLKEKEQLLTSDDLGHDLTSVRSLVSKHKVS